MANGQRRQFHWQSVRNDINFKNPNHWMIVREQAKNKGLEHLQCEPDMDERSNYGLEDIAIIAKCGEQLNSSLSDEEKKPYWVIMDRNSDRREQIWFDRIKDKNQMNILLIVGSSHISTNSKSRGRGIDTILNENGYRFVILPFFE